MCTSMKVITSNKKQCSCKSIEFFACIKRFLQFKYGKTCLKVKKWKTCANPMFISCLEFLFPNFIKNRKLMQAFLSSVLVSNKNDKLARKLSFSHVMFETQSLNILKFLNFWATFHWLNDFFYFIYQNLA